MPGIIVVGVGPGLGTAVARVFSSRPMPAGLIARSQRTLDVAASDLLRNGADVVEVEIADAGVEQELTNALDRLVERNGPPEVLVYNAGLIRADRPGDLRHEELKTAYAINVLGAMTSASHLGKAMGAAGGGSILFTAGMPEPIPSHTSLSLGKAALRSLATLLAEDLAPTGVHVAAITVCGTIGPGTEFDPDVIAKEYVRLHEQPRGMWETNIEFRGQ